MFRRSLLIVFVLFGAHLMPAQDIDQIISKHFEAMGGLVRLMYTSNISMIGDVTVRQGNNSRELIFAHTNLKDGRVKADLMDRLGRVLNTQAFDGVEAWTGTKTKSETITGDARLDFIHRPFLDRFLDREKNARDILNGGETATKYTLVMKDELDRRITVEIDKSSYQIVKESYRDLQGNYHIIESSDFKEFSGLTLPTKVRVSMVPPSDGSSTAERAKKVLTMTYNIDNVIVNASGIKDDMFKRPGG